MRIYVLLRAFDKNKTGRVPILEDINPFPATLLYLDFHPPKLWVADATHNLGGWKSQIFVEFETKHVYILIFKHSLHSQ